VDPVSRRQFWRLIEKLSASGVTLLVTTHYLDEAEHCHRVAIVHGGRLARLGTTAELRGVFAGRTLVEVQTPRPVDAMRLLDARPEVEKTSLFGTSVHAVLASRATAAADVHVWLREAGLPVDRVDEVPPSLEDVFLDVVTQAS
jgi:ABC-2 type transport system ATP-binding protein